VRGGSEVLDAVFHVFRFVVLPDEHKSFDDFTDTKRVLLAVADAAMSRANGVQSKKVLILSKNDPPYTRRP
jgi:hypothetical protein